MKRYALDTNTISYLLKDDPAVSARLRAESDGGNDLIIPLMAFYEVKRGLLTAQASRKMRHFEQFCDDLGVGELSYEVLDKAAYIYADLQRIGRLVDDADIILGAFCVVNGYILVTNNTKHFENIDGLQLVDWVEQRI